MFPLTHSRHLKVDGILLKQLLWIGQDSNESPAKQVLVPETCLNNLGLRLTDYYFPIARVVDT